MDQPKLWTKDFVIITTANFFLYIAFYILISTITLFAAETLHAAPSTAGLASSIFMIGILIARLLAGRYINQIGWKRVLVVGFTLFFLTTCLYLPVHSLGWLLLVRLINGFAMGIATTATGAIAAGIIPNERRGEGTGYFILSLTIASAVGPYLGMTVSANAAFMWNFYICIALLALNFITLFFVRIPSVAFSAREAPAGQTRQKFSPHRFIEVKALPIGAVTFVIAVAYMSILSFYSSFTKELDLVAVGSTYFIVYALVVLLSRPLIGRLFDSKGENSVMYPAIVVMVLSLLTLYFTQSGFGLLLSGALLGLGYGTTQSSVQAISIKVSPRHRIALATSTGFICQDIGMGLGPFLLGTFIPLIGYRNLYLAMSGVALCALLLYYLLHGRRAAQPRQENTAT
ncbi:MAG: MFS transporter [Peptococcaceae bacterium]|jgi:MFS family permease|nr:MFS transporter [Peptococcaceae bacterium]